MTNLQRVIKIKEITDKVSPTFCLAKWHHPTIMLQTGQTTSCCHVPPHHIPVAEIIEKPSALHNTQRSRDDRLKLHNGEQISSCNYCWNIENINSDILSARKEWNASIFNQERFHQIIENPAGDINPQYIEISFGNECNFKCGYCHPKFSTAYYKEIKQFGPYPTKHHGFGVDGLVLYEEESNPYVEAWWQWWPEVSKTLNILRITGGEPLLQISTWRLFNELENNPLPNLELNVNSNLGVKPVLVQRLAEKVNLLWDKKSFRSFKLFTSLDTWGKPAEYIRTGLDLDVWEKNFHYYLTNTPFPVTIMVTYNILSVTGFKKFLEKILEWRKVYGWYNHLKEHRVRFDVPYLFEPLQYSIALLPKEQFLPYLYECLKFIKENVNDASAHHFSQIEFEKFNQVVKYMETTNFNDQRLSLGRKDFVKWFAEHDRRRNTNFVNTFPELEQLYNDWQKL